MANEAPNSLGRFQLAWRFLDPYVDTVSIYDGGDEFLRGYANLPPAACALFVVMYADSEICNGGFHQLFENSTGVLAPEAVQGFLTLGLEKCAKIIQAAVSEFDIPYPRDRSIRRDILDDLRLPGDTREEWDLFHQYDVKYYKAKMDDDFESRIHHFVKAQTH